jgi:hypothetical protein
MITLSGPCVCRLRVLTLVTGWFAGLVLHAQTEVSLELSEFMAANSKTRADEDGQFSDWIEIRNNGSQAANLQDWTLTDNPTLPAKWAFPSTNLPSGGFLVVFASGKDRRVPGKPLHTNFSLNADGEYLALASPEGEIATRYVPEFPEQRDDLSYGLRLGRPYFFTQPTPGAANVGGFNEFVADTKFSQDRGFHTLPFDLAITCATANATIRFTTNGTLPALTNGFTYTAPIRIAGTTVVRAAGFKSGEQPSNVDTQTYLFLDDVLKQSPTGAPPPGWPASWSPNVRDYGMDPDIINRPAYASRIRDDLKSIPSFSIVMDLNDLFSSGRGIYANASWQGRSAERKCSLELIRADGQDGFQIDCGIRIRGGYSRSTGNPKHGLRFLFRGEYGAPKLRYPLLSQAGTEEFDGIDLRTFQNYSWSFEGDSRGIFMRDQFSRDAQFEMGHDAERGDYFHLYLNGQYWGLYNTCERPEASYAATYFGGEKEDYDVVKVEAGPYSVVATDGNLQAWTRLYNACKGDLSSIAAYEKLLGNNPDGTPNPAYERLLEPENLIDYMLVIVYGGNLDAPISNFLSNTRPNNWYGIRSRVGREGFRFFAHDAEHTLLGLNENRVGPFSAGDTSVTYSSPQWVWQKLWANAEFRLLVADRIHRHFYNGGALTPEACRARLLRRKAEIDGAVVGESARWGDSKSAQPLTHENWLTAVDGVVNSYLPQRSAIVVNQLKTRALYPAVAAPAFSRHGGAVTAGFPVSIQAPAGQTWLTWDGSDPRVRGGAISPAAREATAPVVINESLTLKARTWSGGTWSALNEATFTVIQTYTNLLITEIMYHPQADEAGEDDDYEFIELKNVNPFEIDLSGVSFTNGLSHAFPSGTRLGAGQFLVLGRDAAAIASRYPTARLDGVYTGSLNNGGERLTLVHAVGTTLCSVAYGDAPPWPTTADGQGFSLVPVDANANATPDSPASWRASTVVGGSPGRDDPPGGGVPPVVINELLAHTDPPQLDAVELHNPTATPADIGHWYLTDDRSVPRKFRIPANTVIPAGGFAVFSELDFNAPPGAPSAFSFSSHGDEVYLYSGNAASELTGYSDGFSVGASANGVSFGRLTNHVGEVQFPAQTTTSLGAANPGPRIGPVVINEIHYQPAAGDVEFVELKNLTDDPVSLAHDLYPANTWRIEGLGFAFPAGTVLPPQGLAVVVAGDPAGFRARYGVPATVPVFGPCAGVLQNSGELLELQRPDAPDLVTNEFGQVSVLVPYLTLDAVRYNDKLPWPTNAAGLGPSLERLRAATYGNDPANWRSSFGPGSPGLDNDGNRPPFVQAGQDQEFETDVFPAIAALTASASDDGLPEAAALTVTWQQLSGPGRVVFAEPGKLASQVALPGVGSYLLRVTVSDGALQRSDEVGVTVGRPTTQQTPVLAGSVWRYLDDGSDQGTAWRAGGFNDAGWKSGKARLGYGGDGEVTAVQTGPSNNKYVTTYFRSTFQVTSPAAVTGLTLKVIRDDGIVVYLNNQEVMRDNLPEGTISFTTTANTAIGGTDETTFLERTLDPALLRAGVNQLAVEMHQANVTSSDLGFDLQLEAAVFPANQPPTLNAGEDRVTTVGEAAPLRATFRDDGLPNPPGVVAFSWVKVSGPGAVSFTDPAAWVTTAAFDQPGAYVLRLSASDGASAVEDEIAVTVKPATAPPQIGAVELRPGPSPTLQLQITASPGTWLLQSRESLGTGTWQTQAELTIPPGGNALTTSAPVLLDRVAVFYRVAAKP